MMKTLNSLFAIAVVGLALPVMGSAQTPEEMARGAAAWAQNCTRCHNARPSAERSDRDWSTIVAHMRARANITRSDARSITVFLSATNGMGAMAASSEEPVVPLTEEPFPQPEEAGSGDETSIQAPDRRAEAAQTV